MCVTGATTPQRLLLVADWGLSHNSSVTLQHLLQSAANTTTAPAVLYIADFCYAGRFFLHVSLKHLPILSLAHRLSCSLAISPNYRVAHASELLVQFKSLYMPYGGACMHAYKHMCWRHVF